MPFHDKKGFTPLNKAADEIGSNNLVAVGGLKPPTSLPRYHEVVLRGDTYLTGFTIIEILVAFAVVTIGLLGVVSLVVQNLQVQNINRNYVVAAMLAQEGIELVRNQRDLNWLTPGNDWDEDINVGDTDGTFVIDYDDAPPFNDTPDLVSDNGAQLSIDGSNYYVHGAGNATPFYRLITVSPIPPEGLKVTAHVQWQERNRTHNYKTEVHLYNWRE